MSTTPCTDWLLASLEPKVRLRTRRELLCMPDDDPAVQGGRWTRFASPLGRDTVLYLRRRG